MSAESRFIGYVVLGFGILAVVAVLMLAFMGRTPETKVVQQPDPQKTEAIAGKSIPLIKPPKPIPPPPEYTSPFKRQPEFNKDDLDGNWQTMIGKYTSVLQMNKGVYQVILAGDNPKTPRYYSSGTYKVIEDIIVFEPQLDWPPPITKTGRDNYQTITLAPFNMMTALKDGKLLWANIPPNENRASRIVQPPLFMSEDVDYVVWAPIQ